MIGHWLRYVALFTGRIKTQFGNSVSICSARSSFKSASVQTMIYRFVNGSAPSRLISSVTQLNDSFWIAEKNRTTVCASCGSSGFSSVSLPNANRCPTDCFVCHSCQPIRISFLALLNRRFFPPRIESGAIKRFSKSDRLTRGRISTTAQMLA